MLIVEKAERLYADIFFYVANLDLTFLISIERKDPRGKKLFGHSQPFPAIRSHSRPFPAIPGHSQPFPVIRSHSKSTPSQRCAGHQIFVPRGTRPVGLQNPTRLVPQLILLNVTRTRLVPVHLHPVPPAPVEASSLIQPARPCQFRDEPRPAPVHPRKILFIT